MTLKKLTKGNYSNNFKLLQIVLKFCNHWKLVDIIYKKIFIIK